MCNPLWRKQGALYCWGTAEREVREGDVFVNEYAVDSRGCEVHGDERSMDRMRGLPHVRVSVQMSVLAHFQYNKLAGMTGNEQLWSELRWKKDCV